MTTPTGRTTRASEPGQVPEFGEFDAGAGVRVRNLPGGRGVVDGVSGIGVLLGNGVWVRICAGKSVFVWIGTGVSEAVGVGVVSADDDREWRRGLRWTQRIGRGNPRGSAGCFGPSRGRDSYRGCDRALQSTCRARVWVSRGCHKTNYEYQHNLEHRRAFQARTPTQHRD